MDANQRSESNNQTNNGANEKWTPGSKGNTTSGPMDHTHPQGAAQQQGQQGAGRMGSPPTGAQSGAPGENWFQRDDSSSPASSGELPGGSMQSQQTGGSGAQQGITDSHQRQMEIHSEAWGLLEQPVGRRSKDTGTDVGPHGLAAQSMQHARMEEQQHQFSWQQEAQSQQYGQQLAERQQDADPTRQAGQSQQTSQSQQSGRPEQASQSQHATQPQQMSHSQQAAHPQQMSQSQQAAQPQQASQSQQAAQPQQGSQSQAPAHQQQANQSQQAGHQQQAGQSQQYSEAQFGQSEPSEQPQQSVDRAGSQTGPGARESGTEDVHVSNDVSGGLPRSPGNSGPRRDNAGWQPGGSMQRDPAVHESNDVAGGLPRSPAGANRLAGDRKMDDDTGFSRK